MKNRVNVSKRRYRNTIFFGCACLYEINSQKNLQRKSQLNQRY